ncbi:hypothetical protein Hanom_Chr17g01525661 [Helianthus anomalus]
MTNLHTLKTWAPKVMTIMTIIIILHIVIITWVLDRVRESFFNRPDPVSFGCGGSLSRCAL